ncbi:MAG TPA: glycosyltransferase family 1 protein [Gaiellaceae bacterium]|nr:glycosyltransferase family 1 protein [Gaiellaceae bacterium]
MAGAEPGPIVVDGVFFQHRVTTGVARVWQSHLQEWVKSGFARRLLLLDRGGAPRLPGLRTRSLARWDPDRTAEDSLLLQRVCDEEGAALFVSTYYTAPISTPSLMLVYDLIPERLGLDMSDPSWTEKRLAVEHASSYACISENTLKDLHELEPTSRGKPAHVTTLGVEEHFRPTSADDVAAFLTARGIQRPYFLLVGERRGRDGYKNTELLFRALHDSSELSECEVVCVGGRPNIEPELRLAGPEVRTHRFSLSDAELRFAYAGAIALVYPSRYEGFGLPVAEAMACGCPVITTKLASLPEVAGDAALYVDPDDPQELRQALDAVREPDRRAAMVAAGMSRASAFRWSQASAAFASALSGAASAETAEQRRARDAAWRPRREAQAAGQRKRRNSVQRLKSAAMRYLPSRAVVLLRSRTRIFN